MAINTLSRDFPVRWYDPNKTGGSTLQETLAADVVVLCVPISKIPEICRQISPSLRPGQLIVDTCSVKMRPIAWLLETLPQAVDILGTHPLFGPDSAKQGIAGLKIAVCPVRGNRIGPIRDYLETLGLEVIETTPEEHDREMAQTQAVFHVISRAIQGAGLNRRRISTPGPEQFFDLLYSLQNDSPQLFLDLESHNPYAASVRRRLIQALIDLDEQISEGEGRKLQVEGRKSPVESRKFKVKGRKSKVESRKSKANSKVRSRGRKS
jgi:prephenate dehydrogenase